MNYIDIIDKNNLFLYVNFRRFRVKEVVSDKILKICLI